MATRRVGTPNRPLLLPLVAALALVATTLVFGFVARPAGAVLGINGMVGSPSATTYGKTVTFTGSVTNSGTGAAEDLTAVTITNDSSSGLVIPLPSVVGPLAAGANSPFTVTALITGAPGTMAQLRLKATGANVGGAQTADIDGMAFTVTDAVVLTVTADRKQLAMYSPCVPGTCTVSIDDGLRYTVKVENLADNPAATAFDVKINAPVPANTTNVATSTIPAGPIPTPLAPGTSQTFIREVTVNDPPNDVDPPQPGAVISFSATATYDTAAPAVLNDRTAAGSPASITAAVSDPRLIITNVLNDTNGGDLVRGDVVGSTVTIDNTGDLDANDTVVTVTLDSNLTAPTDVRVGGAVPSPANLVTVTPTSVTVRIGAGANPAMGGTVTPATAPIVVSFSATAATTPTGSPPVVQTTASVDFTNGGVNPKTATAMLAIVGQPSITLVVAPTPPTTTQVPRGSTISYVVTATNDTGVAAATNLKISFPIPEETTFSSATASLGGSTPAGDPAGPITTTFPTLAPGASASLTVVVTVKANAAEDAGPANDIEANATATFGPGTNAPVPADTVAHELSVATLAVTNLLTDVNGGQLIFGEATTTTITVDNTGTSTATDVAVTVSLANLAAPTNVRINGAAAPAAQVGNAPGLLTVRIGTGAGASGGTITPAAAAIVITFDAAVVAAPTPPLTASTSASVAFGNGGTSNGPVAASLPIVGPPAVTLGIVATPGPPASAPRDSDITYVITATNAGSRADATGVQISFAIPEETTFVSATPSAGGSAVAGGPLGPLTTTFPTLASGSSATLTVVVHVGANPAKDPGPANDIDASAQATYGPGGLTAPPVAVALEISTADLTLGISPTTQSIQKRKDADVVVSLGNNGPDAATGTKTITINLTGDGEIRSASGCTVNGAGTQAVCAVSTDLASGSSVTRTLKVRGAEPGTATLTATLVTTGVEIDETPANNVPVVATVTFQQSATDLSITASPVTEALIVNGDTKDVTFTLAVNDSDSPPNQNDEAEDVSVAFTLPAGVRATAAVPAGGETPRSCTGLPTIPGGSFTCMFDAVNDGDTATVTVTLQGTALLTVAAPITATATVSNSDVPPTNNSASVNLTVGPQPVDLSVANDLGNVTITTDSPSDNDAIKTFAVTVTNGSSRFATGDYTLTIAAGAGVTLTATPAGCLGGGTGTLTCSGGLPTSGNRVYTVTATITAPGPVTVNATVALNESIALNPPQDDTNATNDGPVAGTITRNLPPAALADVGPTLPTGSTLVFDVLRNDTDGDAADVATLVPTGPFTGTAGLVVTVEGRKLKVVVPAGEPTATLTVGYAVTDGRGTPVGSTPVTLKLRVAPAIDTTVDGSFGDAPDTTPQTFGVDVPPDLLDATTTKIDVLDDDLGETADGTPFVGVDYRLTPTFGATNVTGSTVVLADDAAATGGKVAGYTPTKGYTSDVPVNAPVPTPTAPPDSFGYTATGTLGATELFNVAATAKVKVRNQLPIGLDTLVQIFPGTTGANVVPPLDNDLDGNTVADPVLVGGSPFVFDDRGRLNLGFRLKIQCIGPEPAPDLFDPLSGLPPVPSTDECTKPGMKTAGQELTVAAPPDSTGNVSGSITATLVDAGAEALRQLEVMIDPTVTGTVNFGVIVVDNFGGAAWSRVSIKVPDTPPELLPLEQTVPKNSPPVEVFDTVKGTRDINREVVIVSSVTDPAHGTATISADRTKILYEPDRDYVGPDSLDLNVSDASGVGSNSARMSITVKEPVVNPVAGAGGGGGGGAGTSPAGSLPATGGDPLALTGAGGLALLAGVSLVQASRRRRSLPLLVGARHLRG